MFRKLFSRFYREEDGGVFLFVGLSAITLIAFVGLAIDLGNWYTEKRKLQTAADTVAIAAALERSRGASAGDVLVRAKAVALKNGYVHGTNGVTVTINNPPASGNFAGDAAYVEAIVVQPTSALFSAVVNPNQTVIAARAVSTTILQPACLYSLDPTGSGAVKIQGNGSLTMNCGLQVNSNSGNAIEFVGALSGCVDVTDISVTGDIGFSGGATPCVNTNNTTTGTPPAEDPFSYLTPPTVPGDCSGNIEGVPWGAPFLPASGDTIQPGCYQAGIVLQGGLYHFAPGLFIIDTAGLHMVGGGNVDGVDMTIYFPATATGPPLGAPGVKNTVLNIAGGYSTDLKASHPDYPGILFYQDPNTPDWVKVNMVGGATMTLEGVMYFPRSTVRYAGNPSSGSNWTILVSYRTEIIGSTSFLNGSMPGQTPLSVSIASLAE